MEKERNLLREEKIREAKKKELKEEKRLEYMLYDLLECNEKNK
jgi:hypothetical protein